MASTAAKKSSVISDAVLEKAAPRQRSNAKSVSAAVEQISANPVYKVMFDPALSLEERQAEVAKIMTSTMDRETDRANVKAFEDFREWLSVQNTELNEQMISLTNVDTMSELQSVIREMNEDLQGFNDMMTPIMDIIDGIYQLRTNGAVADAFREIKRDEELQAQIDADIEKLNLKIDAVNARIDAAKQTKVDASTKRSFFGLGGLTAEAQRMIAQADMDIAEAKSEVEKHQAEIDALKKRAPDASDLGELAVYKEKLKELLDLSAEENRDRVIALRDSASKFITTAKDRTGSLRGQFDSLKNQLENVSDNNSMMRQTYLVMNEGLIEAEKANSAIREGLIEKEDESALERSTREEKLRNLDGHIALVKESQGDSLATAGDLDQQAVRVATMQQATHQQIATARSLNTQGVSATSDRLAVVLNAVSGAALGEASAVAQDTLQQMRSSTRDVAQREVIRVAMGGDRVNDQLSMIADELAELGEVQRTATSIARNGMSEMKERMETLRQQSSELRDSMRKHIAIAAEADGVDDEPAAVDFNSPFKKG